MKSLASLFAVLTVSAGACADGTGRLPNTNGPVRVFILAGQSNASGYNDYRQYRQGTAPMPDAFLHQPDILFWNAAAGAWTNLHLGASEASSACAFGPELAFAHDVAAQRPGERIALVKCAAGGTGIARSCDYSDYIPSLKGFDDKGRNWHPPGDGKAAGDLYEQMIRTVRHARSALEKDGLEYDLSAFLWMQGEHEAGISPRMAGDYALLLKSLIHAVRADLQAPHLPFAVGEVNSHTWAYGDVVRKAQADVCAEDRNAVLVRTTDLPRQGSGGAAHFDADGMLELGSRFAAAVLPEPTANQKAGAQAAPASGTQGTSPAGTGEAPPVPNGAQ